MMRSFSPSVKLLAGLRVFKGTCSFVGRQLWIQRARAHTTAEKSMRHTWAKPVVRRAGQGHLGHVLKE